MHGVHDKVERERQEKLSKAMKAPIDIERLRQKGIKERIGKKIKNIGLQTL